ncbi:MAG: hypothetical protein ACE5GY_07750 [Thermodesulfobacteriota bacterium]
MADQRIQYSELMVGSGHPTKADTLNRLALVEHNTDGTHKTLSKVTDPYRDPRADGGVGDGTTDDKTALDLTFANAVIQIPEGTWMGYDLSLSGVNRLTGLGQGSIIKCNSLAANYVIGFQGSGQSTLVIDDLVVDGNKALGTYTGSGHGVDIRGYDEVYIGRLEVRNASGHGFQLADCAKVRIGTLVVHDCDKYGVVFDSNGGSGLSEDINIDTLVAYNNGTANYSGINFSDLTSTPTGSRRVVIGKVLSFGNTRDGIAFGRNATSGDTGPCEIAVGEMLLYSNGNYGAELFGCHNVAIGNIVAHDNTYSGVGILHGDLAPGPEAYCENVSIGNIVSYNNGQHGVEITGGKKLHIDGIIAYNNSQTTTTTYDGVYIHETGVTSGSTINTDIVIDKLHAYDDQGTATQQYGLNVKQTVSDGGNYVRHFTASGNVTGDYNLTWPGTPFNPINLNGRWHSFITTTDATANVVALKTPVIADNSVVLAKATVIGANSNGTVRCVYDIEHAYWKDGVNPLATMGSLVTQHSVETDVGLDALFGIAGTDRISVLVTGKAATTMTWKVYVTLDEMKAY